MNRITGILVASLLVLLGGLIGPREGSAQSVLVSGTVLDADNRRPIELALIQWKGIQATTDSAGLYTLILPGNEANKAIEVVASSNGYIPQQATAVASDAAATADFLMQRRALLEQGDRPSQGPEVPQAIEVVPVVTKEVLARFDFLDNPNLVVDVASLRAQLNKVSATLITRETAAAAIGHTHLDVAMRDQVQCAPPNTPDWPTTCRVVGDGIGAMFLGIGPTSSGWDFMIQTGFNVEGHGTAGEMRLYRYRWDGANWLLADDKLLMTGH